jgi:hypothetical protein
MDAERTAEGTMEMVAVPRVPDCTGKSEDTLAVELSDIWVQATQEPSGLRTAFQNGGIPALVMAGVAAAFRVAHV